MLLESGLQQAKTCRRVWWGDLDLVVEAPFADSRVVELGEPIGGCDHKHGVATDIHKFGQQQIDDVAGFRSVLAGAVTTDDEGVDFVDEEHAWPGTACLLEGGSDVARGLAYPLRDGLAVVEHQELDFEFSCERFGDGGLAITGAAEEQDAVARVIAVLGA